MEGEIVQVNEALGRARRGEATAFALIYERYGEAIHRYAYRLLGDQTQAEDIVQDTFLRAFQNISRLRDDSRLEPWLYAIASHACLDLLRRKRLFSWFLLKRGYGGSVDSESNQLSRMAEAELVRCTLAQMPPQYAACLILRSVEGFSVEEIAEILGTSKGAIWTRLSRAREMFVQIYGRVSGGKGDGMSRL
ncbi:MAG: RNA polymerase sigma factor [Chloroflexi bacterium]|nr:RNA polymerase sigma factor [Chloroflexota bacterium]MCL5074686.1 RNA polymerase sigma factor [Chloroflexota bacterium]